jgi:hypothetical protein
MTTPTARLLAAVESGPLWSNADLVISKSVCDMIRAVFQNEEYDSNFFGAYDGDVTAAISLCEALLPGWMWNLESGADAIVWTQDDPSIQAHGFADTPARALLIALLRALVAQEAV